MDKMLKSGGSSSRQQSALPPLPTAAQVDILPTVDEAATPEGIDNPLYQSLTECLSGSESSSIQQPADKDTYADIDQPQPHYQTVVSGTPVSADDADDADDVSLYAHIDVQQEQPRPR